MGKDVGAGRAGWRRLSEPRWVAGIDGMILDLNPGCGARETALLRTAMHLMVAAPRRLAAWLGPVADVEAIECMLAAGAVESAALSLIPDHARYMLSRGPGGLHLASIVVPGSAREEYTAQGDTAALALLTAFVAAMRDAAGLLFPDSERLN